MSGRTIVQVIDFGGSTGGSFIPALRALGVAAAAQGDRMIVVARDIAGARWHDDLRASGIELQLVTGNRELVDRLRRLQPDIVHTHFNQFDLAALAGALTSRIFWHVHSYRDHDSMLARAKALVKFRALGLRVERLVAVSEATKSELIEWNAPRDRVCVVPNGVDTNHFRPPSQEERAAARAALGIASGDRVVLFFERTPAKGGATVRGALEHVSGLRALIVGGNEADRARFGTAPQVISIERVADARSVYWAADALAFASEAEAFGFVVAEALASGLPVAASDLPVVREVCADVPSVYRFPVGDASACAAALRSALATTDTSAARVRMTELFSMSRWTHDMLKLYAS